jgi:thiol-disulfide isomerase/thioredoxin
MKRSFLRHCSLAGLVFLAAGLASPAAQAQSLTCRPNYDYSVEVDGAFPRDARFYQSEARGTGRYFIDIPGCKDGLLMDLGARKIFAVPRALVSPAGNGGVVVKEIPAGGTAYAFAIEGAVINFKAEHKKVRIMPVLMRPPLTGPIALETLVADRPEYREGMKIYTPHPESLQAIRKSGKPIEIEAFFGTWCSHCKEYMPKFLRVVDECRSALKVNLVGVPKGWSEAAGPWQGKNVQTIPTIIVKMDGREITRLGSQPGATPEVELAGILKALQ